MDQCFVLIQFKMCFAKLAKCASFTHLFIYFFLNYIMFFDVDEAATTSQIRTAIRQNILRLLMSTLEQPTPNLAHFLLGFELRKPVSKTNLQDPGTDYSVFISVLTCQTLTMNQSIILHYCPCPLKNTVFGGV